ncbi:MAG TPA: hypothetical protein VNJ52_04880 [Patescibacteria group bacterium]|nr:hypothetical protein [Patescibacteria group bacterium]
MTEPTKEEIDAHIAFLEEEAKKDIRPKYLKGQDEHGGKLWEKNIVPLLDEEITDIKAYWPTLKRQIEKLVAAAEKAVSGEGTEDLHDALAPFHFKAKEGND